jgi:hypothetical protein
LSKHVRMHGRQPGTSGRLGEQKVHRLTCEEQDARVGIDP